MNTNETQEIEIPDTWDVTVQAAERRGICIGIEKMRDVFLKEAYWTNNKIKAEAKRLLAEQEEK